MSLQDFFTGAVRDSPEGKGRFDLISPLALRRLAQRCEDGAKQYGERNWEKGMPLSRCLDAALRHLASHLECDNSEDHLAAAAWNIFAMMHTEEMISRGRLPTSLNQLPYYQP